MVVVVEATGGVMPSAALGFDGSDGDVATGAGEGEQAPRIKAERERKRRIHWFGGGSVVFVRRSLLLRILRVHVLAMEA